MKKLSLILITVLCQLCNTVNAQVTQGNNTYVAGSPFVGWNNTSSHQLDIVNDNAQPINFYTNAGGTFANQRMIIKSSGEVGIGTTTPSSWLHVSSTGTGEAFRTTSPSGNDTYWRMYEGTTEYGRFTHFSGGNGFLVISPQGPLRLGSGASGTTVPAVYIIGGSGSNKGYTGIGDYTNFTPGRRLDIYDPTNPQMRLSYNYGASGAVSTIYTDFQTTSAGDLYINPMNSTTPKGVGIGTSTVPATTKVEIDAYIPTSAASSEALKIKSIQSTNVTDNYGAKIAVEGGTNSTTGMDINLSNSTTTSTGMNINNACTGASGIGAYGIVIKTSGQTNSANYGMLINSTDATGVNYGIDAYSGNYNTGNATQNYGVHARGNYGQETWGVHGEAWNGSVQNVGVEGDGVSSNGTNYGVLGYAGNGTVNYGVRGEVSISSCTTGGSCVKAAGYFNGAVYTTLAGYYSSSDQRIKKNILPLINTNSILMALQPKSFDYDTAAIPQMNMSEGNHFGLIAQEVEQILPTLIKNFVIPATYDKAGNITNPQADVKALNYTEIIPFLIQGYKEQQVKITSQQAQLDSLIAALGGSPRPANNINPISQKIELSDKQGIILNQNDPNPFSESTVITYSIPIEVKDAKIMFTDNRGTVLRTAKIESRGQGSLEVYASELSSGIYTYTLVCDGKTIESKKMMKTK